MQSFLLSQLKILQNPPKVITIAMKSIILTEMIGLGQVELDLEEAFAELTGSEPRPKPVELQKIVQVFSVSIPLIHLRRI